MSTPNTQSNPINRAFGFIALTLFIVLIIAAIALPIIFNTSGTLVITIFTFLLTIVGIFIAFIQAFPSAKDHFKAVKLHHIGRSTAVVSVLLLFSITLNAFVFIRQGPNLTHTPGALPSTTPSNSDPTSTSTQIASATASSVVANGSLPPEITVHGTPVISDPMVNNSRGYQWDTSDDTGSGNQGSGWCEFTGVGFHIKADNDYRECVEYKDDLTNFVLEAQMTPYPGSAGGFILRRNTSNGVGYLFDFGPSGHYSIHKDPNNVILRDAYSPLIQPNHTSYLVVIEVLRNQITIYIDNVKIDSITDNTYSHGHIGLYVTGDNGTPKTEVAFANVRVWSL